jgi:hypothetical protein
VKPGDSFEVQISADGTRIELKLVNSAGARLARVKVEKRNGYSVGVLDQPISEQGLAEALSDFP